MGNVWFDDPKCSIKQKLKIVETLLKLDKQRLDLLPLDQVFEELVERQQKVILREKKLGLKEVKFKAKLEKRNLTMRDIEDF